MDDRFYKEEMNRLREAYAFEQQKAEFDKQANIMRGLYMSYVNVGFSEEQAWELVKSVLENSLKNGN